MSAPKILEITFFGRAGQGAKTATELLAKTALRSNFYFQAFPQFGPERRGAPVEAYLRLSPEPIELHSQIELPNIAVVMDSGLLTNSTEDRLGHETILLNANQKTARSFDRDQVSYFVDASRIATFFLGQNRPNLILANALLAVIAKEYPNYKMATDDLEAVIRDQFRDRWDKNQVEKNLAAIEKGTEEVIRLNHCQHH